MRILALALLFVVSPASAQMRTSAATTGTGDLSDVRPFQAWVADAVFTRGVDVEPEFRFQDVDFAKFIVAGARVAAWVNPDLEAGGRWGFASFDPEVGDGGTGLRDLDLYARHRIPVDADLDLAVGTEIGLPIGDDDVGAGNFEFRGFVAMRHDVDGDMTLLANAGLESIERGDDREFGLLLGGGVIVPITEEAALVTELTFSTAAEIAQITGGVDFELPPGGHLRAALALGLDDGAPDVEVVLGFAIPVY